MKQDLLGALRAGRRLSLRQQIGLVAQLSVPAILAQVSSIVMQYIDTSMVGSLGTNASAAIGLVASTTWLFGGLCRALMVGFCVQTAQRIGAGDGRGAGYGAGGGGRCAAAVRGAAAAQPDAEAAAGRAAAPCTAAA